MSDAARQKSLMPDQSQDALHTAVAHHQAGMLAMQQGLFADALRCFMAAIEAAPACAPYWLSYISALLQSGQPDEARQVLEIARQQGLQGDDVEALALRLAVPLATEGAAAPPSSQAANELAVLFAQGRLAETARRARAMTREFPDFGYGWKMLGAATPGSADALHPMQRAAALLPDDFEVHYNLGLILQELGRLDEASLSYRRALQINPGYAHGHNNLGVTLQELGRLAEAEACYRCAINIDPHYVNALHNLGIVLQGLNRFAEAETIHRRTLDMNPGHADAYCNLGSAQLVMGRLEEAVASYRQALQFKPGFVVAHSNLIFSMDMMETLSPDELQAERDRWAEVHAAPLWRDVAYANARIADRPLRIGYISADFREHSASKVFGGMLTQYDRAQFEVYAYANSRVKDDRYTGLFRKNVTVWRDVAGLSDEAVASLICEDNIDLLVDLSGHTSGNRLLVFARKPAPVQITALGYAAGTGMRAMDAFFTDAVMVPPEEQRFYREKIRYLSCALGLFTMDPFPPVNALPALSNGMVTFASFNRMAKVSDSTYRAWIDILKAVPQSRLLLKTVQLDDIEIRRRILGIFTREGIEAERIVMQGKTAWQEHMLAYHQVDIALDPFPHGGGVTALEGLMMGVPVMTRRGATLTGRISASIMTTLGLTDWIAETPSQYVEMAVSKAKDQHALSELRGRLRGIFTSSVLGDQATFVRSVELEYRQLWQEWCARASGRQA
jgi:protein O-GlcNAc transferase